jgi:ABC-type transport system substrate-binding protein
MLPKLRLQPDSSAARFAHHASATGNLTMPYPCHVSPPEMRQHPIGTGPFKFVEFRPNERITVTRNPDYWTTASRLAEGH